MIVACPQCAARYRIDPTRVGPKGARMRCAKCESVFRVAAEPAAAEAAAPPSPQHPQSAPAVAKATAAPSAAPTEQEAPRIDRDRAVLVADSDAESAKRTAGALTEWGLAPLVVLDGVEAILAIQRMLPRVIVLDAGLTRMYGFQVCEIVKRNESLREIKVVLVGSIHDADRYRRPPVELYGADVYLEKPDIPDALLPCLRQFGMPVPGDASSQHSTAAEASMGAPDPIVAEASMGAQPESLAPPQGEVAPPQPVPVVEDPLAQQRATAERLARIIVSDIVLYNPDKFEQAARAGNVAEALHSDLHEGRNLFRQRIDPRVLEEKDHLVEELLRVAREKGLL